MPSPSPTSSSSARSRRRGWALWILSLLLTLGLATYQRLTGPTHPQRVSFSVAGTSHSARLNRSGTTGEPARIELPAPPPGTSATLWWRRFPTNDEYEALSMASDGDRAAANLPSQPPAGKVEYFVTLAPADGETVRVPAEPGEDPVLRFKGPVDLGVLLPHITAMFLAMWLGIRAALSALLGRPQMRRLTWITLALLTVGGLLLGPIAQYQAFGEYWTGWPNGKDLTDNKVLLTWTVWLLATLATAWGAAKRPKIARLAVFLAAVVMLGVYLIPHSARGSQLDYDKLREGVPAHEAIETGR